jgi:hypothetical protein
MTDTCTQPWEGKRTDETRRVEETLIDAGFDRVDAYRYNAASIRVRVIDSRFEEMPIEDRDKMVEPHLEQLPERTQADIMNLFTFAPSEIEPTSKSLRTVLMNTEFEHPSPSML